MTIGCHGPHDHVLLLSWLVVCCTFHDDQLRRGVTWHVQSRDVMTSLFMILQEVLLFVHDVAIGVRVQEPC